MGGRHACRGKGSVFSKSFYFDCIRSSTLIDPPGCQAFALFPVVEARSFVPLQSTGGVSTDEVGMVAVEFPMQRGSQHGANLRNGDGRGGFFSPAGFPA